MAVIPVPAVGIEISATDFGIPIANRHNESEGAWLPITVMAGWTNPYNGYQQLAIRRVGNAVQVRGVIMRSGSTAVGPGPITLSFGIPNVGRPLLPQVMAGTCGASADANYCRIDIAAGGGMSAVIPIAIPTTGYMALVATYWVD